MTGRVHETGAERGLASLQVGQTIGKSPWVKVNQVDIDIFGAVTRDLEPLHNDPKWCEENSPFGVPIAYGFQTLALLTHLFHKATGSVFSGGYGTNDFPINYGFNRVRLMAPVLAGSEVRGVFRLLSHEERRPGESMIRIETIVEIRGRDKPALVGEWLYLWVSGEGRSAVSRSVRDVD